MKKTILVLLVIVALGWAVFDFFSTSNGTAFDDNNNLGGGKIFSPPSAGSEGKVGKVEETDEVGISLGQIAPDFQLKILNGETVHLSDFRGERVILNFWATWCPPCREEIPDFQKLYEKHDVEILAVDLLDTEESMEDVKGFVKEYEMTFRVLLDENSDVANMYQIVAYPTSYMIDSSGHIQFAAIGAMNYDLMVQELAKME